jgi:predicted transcriptional regulator
MAKRKSILSLNVKNQLVALRKQGKTLSEMAEITGLSYNNIRHIRSEFIKKGVWSYSKIWQTRVKNQRKKSTISNSLEPEVKRVYTKREPQKVDTVTINFKGINVEVQKSSKIIVTDTVIYVK